MSDRGSNGSTCGRIILETTIALFVVGDTRGFNISLMEDASVLECLAKHLTSIHWHCIGRLVNLHVVRRIFRVPSLGNVSALLNSSWL